MPSTATASPGGLEQTSDNLLSVNYGTLYPALVKLEQEGFITSEWGVSDNNRKAKFYALTRAGRKQSRRRPGSGGKRQGSSPGSLLLRSREATVIEEP